MSRRSRKLNRSSFDSVAEYIRTGTLTSPNEIEPLQIGLMRLRVYPRAPETETSRFYYFRAGAFLVENSVDGVEDA